MKAQSSDQPRVYRHGANYSVIADGVKLILQSYAKIVAINNGGDIVLGRYWDYSRTTKKHVSKFTMNTVPEIRRMIDSGEYEYDENLE